MNDINALNDPDVQEKNDLCASVYIIEEQECTPDDFEKSLAFLPLPNKFTGGGYQVMGTEGNLNTNYGNLSLEFNDSGTNLSAFGSGALRDNISGSDNTAVGAYALQSNTSGNRNTAMGVDALVVSNGSDNTALGYQASE